MTLLGFLALGLAARSCPFTHPYDIIWHWSSCHPSPPCLLPLPSSCPPFLCFRPGTARDASSERRREPNSLVFSARRKQQLLVCRWASVFSFPSVFSPITSALCLYSSLSVFSPLFSPHRLPVCCFLCVSHFLPQSIINFNLRAGLNGTIRERSMLSIWMPARLDLGIPHQMRRGANSSLFIVGTSHSHEPAHPKHWSDARWKR